MIPDEENALVTGDYVIMPYRLLGDPTNEVYILDGHEEGEWWYSSMMACSTLDGLLRERRRSSRLRIGSSTIAATWAATSAACQLR
jgi:hypothetical protein